MNIIKEIKITHFRSFSKTIHIKSCNDLNIFSGKNDSGKSNILKALNLFFTESYVDFYNELDFFVDYSKAMLEKSKERKQKQTIKIAILFDRMNFSSRILPETFWVEKEWERHGNLLSRKTKHKSGALLGDTASIRSTTNFLNKIHFMYIPAIKDSSFFSYLKTEYQNSLGERLLKENNGSSDEEIKISNIANRLSIQHITSLLSEKIDIEAKRMMEHFLGNTKEIEMSNFKIPELDFSKVLEVVTENNIPLTSRGDGVQAKFIPQILNEIVRNKNANFIIWGFEEPENSYEYTNAQILAEKFKNEYSIDKQIFLTSHAFNFITLKGSNISLYRAWKPSFDDGTQIAYLNDDSCLFSNGMSDELIEELGIINLNSELENVYQKTIEEYKNIEVLTKQLASYKKPILYVEDKYDELYKICWLKTNDIDCDRTNFLQKFDDEANFSILRAEGAGNLQGFLTAKNIDYWKEKKIIGLFDFDDEGVERFKATKNHSNWSKNSKKMGDISSGLYSQREDTNFFTLLIPIPAELINFSDYKRVNLIEIENLLPNDFLLQNNFATKNYIFENEYLEIKSDKKSIIWKHVFNLSKEELINFIPLFEKVNQIFQMES